jgi:peptidoglycan/xylan/chitin deacetylase (PgdA/CDA1 family)
MVPEMGRDMLAFAHRSDPAGASFLRFDDVWGDDFVLDTLLDEATALNLECYLAVIPERLTRNRASYIRRASFEVLQHGVVHRNFGRLSEPHDEFPAHRNACIIKESLANGREKLESQLGRSILGYVPPWNFTSDCALRILEELRFELFSASYNHRFTTSMTQSHVAINVLASYTPPVVKDPVSIARELRSFRLPQMGAMFHTGHLSRDCLPRMRQILRLIAGWTVPPQTHQPK